MPINTPISNKGSSTLFSQRYEPGYLTQYCCERMKQERIKKGLTQQDLADMVQVSLDTIQRYETGRVKYLRLDVVCDIAGVLGVPLQSLLPPQTDDIEMQLQHLESAVTSLCTLIRSR